MVALPQVEINSEIVHGAPVFRGTRLPVEAAVESYYAYRELAGMSDQEAVDADFAKLSDHSEGAEGLRSVLEYEASNEVFLLHEGLS